MRINRLVALAAGLVATVIVLVAAMPGGATSSSRRDPTRATSHAGAVATAPTVSSNLTTTTYTFSTATNPINCSANQGWWSIESTNNDCNANYFTGYTPSFGHTDRGYAAFDISASTNPCPPSSAYLSVPTGEGNQAAGFGGPSTVSLGLFDVATDLVTVSEKDNNPNSTIYTDLGTGTMYGGPYTLSTSVGFGTFTLSLNQAGRNALFQAKANHQQYFPIGMGLINPPAGEAWLFGNTGYAPITMTVTYPKLCKVYP